MLGLKLIHVTVSKRVLWCRHIEGILPEGPYLPCVSMAGRALLAVYPRIIGSHCSITNYRADYLFVPSQWAWWETALLCNGVFHWLGINLESALNYNIILQAMMRLLYFKLTQILPSHEDKLQDFSCLYIYIYVITRRICVISFCHAVNDIPI